jgi:hypothetical protein
MECVTWMDRAVSRGFRTGIVKDADLPNGPGRQKISCPTLGSNTRAFQRVPAGNCLSGYRRRRVIDIMSVESEVHGSVRLI